MSVFTRLVNWLHNRQEFSMEITSTQQVPFTIAPKDRKGRPAQVEGIAWASSNEAVATVVPSEDGLTGLVVAGVPGAATISVQADADLGEGEQHLAGTVEITVTPAAAVSIELVPGEVAEQPDEA